MKGKNVVVTGGAGFIGSNLCNHLCKNNNVTAIDNEYLGDRENLDDDVEFILDDAVTVSIDFDVDILFHLAALSSYKMHEESTRKGARVNIEGFVNCVEECSDNGCDTVVYASTSSIYGSRTSPSKENIDVSVNTAYEASKMAREKYAEYYSTHRGMSMAGMRFFSVYQGYGGNEEHKGEFANIISQFADDISKSRSPVIYGDGTQTRDFIHVDDIVKGLEAAADNSLDGIYNLGTQDTLSFNEIVDEINNQLGKNITPEYVDNPIPEHVYVEHTMSDTSKMEIDTEWEPKISIEQGITQVCDHYKHG